MPDPVILSGPDRVRLVLALSRSWVRPFTPNDWMSWAGAEGDAHQVHMLQHDEHYFREVLGLQGVAPDYVTVILDDNGLSWNVSSPVNSYAWMVQVGFDVTSADVPGPSYWEVSDRWGGGLETEIAELPGCSPEQRALMMAAPEAVRHLVVRGYKAQLAEDSVQLEEPAPPQRRKVWLFKGEISGLEENHRGLPAGTPEWQFGDAPNGQQGSSADFLDLYEGLQDHAECDIDVMDAKFNPTEQGIYDRWLCEVAARHSS